MDDEKEKIKFKIRTFLLYLALEPWTEKLTLPNFNTIIWALIILALLLRNIMFLWVSVCIGIIFYGIKEWKSGKFIYWYHQRKYREKNEALKKAREEKLKRFINN